MNIYSGNRNSWLGRFEKFDLAWCSDDATWVKMSRKKGIKTIEGAKVYWRKSQFNITPQNENIVILKRKMDSMIRFSEWVLLQSESAELGISRLQLND